jgi:hypothetical protein
VRARDPSAAFCQTDRERVISMITEHGEAGRFTTLCLRVLAQADPAALGRVLSYFQTLNVVPRRVVAELDSSGAQHIRVETLGVSVQQLAMIGAKLAQHPTVEHADWHVLYPG